MRTKSTGVERIRNKSKGSRMHAHPFELLELPDGRWCVAKLAASAADVLVDGSFVRPALPLHATAAAPADPVGIYPSRDDAELAIQRAVPRPQNFSWWTK